MPLSSGQAYGGALLEAKADAVTLTVKDAAGKVVLTQSLGAKDAGSFYFSWDGKDTNGKQLADGNYSFSVDATVGDKKVTATAMKIGTVSAVARSNGGFVLDLGAQGDVAFKDVQQIL